MKLGASLGGIGALREGLRLVSAMVLLAGLLYADTDIPRTSASRCITPACGAGPPLSVRPANPISAGTCWPGWRRRPAGAPEARTAQYYAKRPCAGLCESAAALLDAYVQENPPENA